MVWNHPPQGGSGGPTNLHHSYSTASSKARHLYPDPAFHVRVHKFRSHYADGSLALHIQGLHTVHGLRPCARGSAPVCLPQCGVGHDAVTGFLSYGPTTCSPPTATLSWRFDSRISPSAGHQLRGRLAATPAGLSPASPSQLSRTHQVDPPASNLDVRFVDKPTIAWGVPAGSGRINQQWGEPVHPAINRDVIDGDAALSQQLLDVTVRQAVPQIPPDRHQDHVWRNRKPVKLDFGTDTWAERRRISAACLTASSTDATDPYGVTP